MIAKINQLDLNKVIFVTSNGWHSGIGLLKTDIPPDLLPEVENFPSARIIVLAGVIKLFTPPII